MKQIKNIAIIASLFLGLTLVSCEDFFDVGGADTSEETGAGVIEDEDQLQGRYWGILSAVASVADQAIFLEGIRSDLLEPTLNASDDIRDLYYYNEDGKNEFADPVGFYTVVSRANSFVSDAVRFYGTDSTNVSSPIVFRAMLAEAIRYKVWAYLQMAKIYGEAVWIDDPIAEYKEEGAGELLKFDELILRCISLIESGTKINEMFVDVRASVRWFPDVLPGVDLKYNRFVPTADCLLTELYLSAGQYKEAIVAGFRAIASGAADNQDKPSFQVTSTEYNSEWIDLFGGFVRTEHMCIIPYGYDDYRETNRLIEYFSNHYEGSKYLFRPSTAALNRVLAQRDVYRGDGTTNLSSHGGEGGGGKTFRNVNGEWVIYKHTRIRYNHVSTADMSYKNDPYICLYRSPDIFLMLMEALANDGRLREAAFLLDGGRLQGARIDGKSLFDQDGEFFRDEIGIDPETGDTIIITKLTDFATTMMRPKDGKNQNNYLGIRGRVDMKSVAMPFLLSNADQPEEYLKRGLDSLIIEEVCLESAAEARSLYAMVRSAKRWGPEVIADRIAAKFPEESREEMRSKLMNPENWYISLSLDEAEEEEPEEEGGE